ADRARRPPSAASRLRDHRRVRCCPDRRRRGRARSGGGLLAPDRQGAAGLMRLIVVIAAKDLRQRLRDRSALLLSVVAPLLLAGIISLAIGGSFTRFRATFAVADEDNGPVAAAFVSGVLRAPALANVVRLRPQ